MSKRDDATPLPSVDEFLAQAKADGRWLPSLDHWEQYARQLHAALSERAASEIPRWKCGWVEASSRCLRLGCGKSGPCEGVPKVVHGSPPSARAAPTPAELMECLKFWRHYSSLSEYGQDEITDERHKWLDKMEDWAT